MTLEDALEILGVTYEVSEKDLKKAYRRLSRSAHPDMAHGSEVKQTELNRAIEMVEAAISANRMLVPKALQVPLQRLELVVVAEQAMRQADNVTRNAKIRSLRRVTDMKWVTLVIAGLSGVLAWLSESVPFSALQSQDAAISGALKTMAVAFGAAAAALQFLTSARSHAIDAYTADLDDKQTCAAELAAALKYHNRTTVVAADVYVSSEPARRGLVPPSLLGHFPRRRLLILKAVGHGLLEEITSEDIGPDRDIRYRLKFQPIRFGTPAGGESEENRKPTTADVSAIGALIGSLISTTFLAWLTFHLFSSGNEGWGWFTGILTAFSGIGTIGLMSGIVAVIRRERGRNAGQWEED